MHGLIFLTENACFIREGNTDEAIEEIIFAIEKAGGYFHEDNVYMVEEAKKCWKENHMS